MNLIEELEKQQGNSERQVRGRFLTQFSMIVEGFGHKYTITQLMHTLLKTGSEKEDSYFWDEDKTLKKTEELYKKLVREDLEEDEE